MKSGMGVIFARDDAAIARSRKWMQEENELAERYKTLTRRVKRTATIVATAAYTCILSAVYVTEHHWSALNDLLPTMVAAEATKDTLRNARTADLTVPSGLPTSLTERIEDAYDERSRTIARLERQHDSLHSAPSYTAERELLKSTNPSVPLVIGGVVLLACAGVVSEVGPRYLRNSHLNKMNDLRKKYS